MLICSSALPAPQSGIPPLFPSTWLACSSFECVLQIQIPTAGSECRSSAYIQKHKNTPSGICKRVGNPSSQKQHCGYSFLAVSCNPTTRSPIVFAFYCSHSGCLLVTQQARVAYLREMNNVMSTMGSTFTIIHKHTHSRQMCTGVLDGHTRTLVKPITHTALIS